MNPAQLYTLGGVCLFTIGTFALLTRAHLLRKILAANVMGSGVFLVLIAEAYRSPSGLPDPVPHAMVLTGIVVAISMTALAVVMLGRLLSISRKGDQE